MTNLESCMLHKWLPRLCTKNSQWYSQTEGKDMLNRCDSRCVWKAENVQDRHRSDGRLFQARGLATAKARSPMVEHQVASTRTSAVDAERSQRCESTSDSARINSDRYCGAALFSSWQWKIIAAVSRVVYLRPTLTRYSNWCDIKAVRHHYLSYPCCGQCQLLFLHFNTPLL